MLVPHCDHQGELKAPSPAIHHSHSPPEEGPGGCEVILSGHGAVGMVLLFKLSLRFLSFSEVLQLGRWIFPVAPPLLETRVAKYSRERGRYGFRKTEPSSYFQPNSAGGHSCLPLSLGKKKLSTGTDITRTGLVLKP